MPDYDHPDIILTAIRQHEGGLTLAEICGETGLVPQDALHWLKAMTFAGTIVEEHYRYRTVIFEKVMQPHENRDFNKP